MDEQSRQLVGRHRRSAFTWIELLVILAILLVIARFASRLLFPQQWRAADRAIERALGLPDEARFVLVGAGVVGVLIYGIVRACQYWRQRWLARRQSRKELR